MLRTIRVLLILNLFLTPVFSQVNMLSDRQLAYRPGDWIGLSMTRFVTAITLDHETVYFGTTHGTMRYQFFENNWDFPLTESDGIEGQTVRDLAYDPNTAYLWIATEKALNYRQPASLQWYQIDMNRSKMGSVSKIGLTDREVWVKSSEGYFVSGNTGHHFVQSTQETAGQKGVHWGSRRYQENTQNPAHYFVDNSYLFFSEGYLQDTHLRQFDLTQTLRDDFSNLWIGTWGLGGARIEVMTKSMEISPFGLYSPGVRCMAWDDNGLWIAGHETPNSPGGITKWDMEFDDWQYFEAPLIPNLFSHNVNTIAVDIDAVWFGTDFGLSRFDKKRAVWRTWDEHAGIWAENVISLALGDQELWIGTEAGINCMKLPSLFISQVRHKPLIHRRIYFLEMDGNDVWAGTDEGIYLYRRATRKWEYVPCYEGMLVHEVTALSVTEKDVWFGTNDGIAVYNKESKNWDGYLQQHHFNQDVFHTILADDNNVWVGTQNGVLKFVRAENRWHRYTVDDGLLDNDVWWILLEGNYVWFGTGSGVNRFYWNAPYRTD